MTSRLVLAFVLSVACLPGAPAEEAAPTSKAPPYVLKNKSAFTPLSEDERAPFWPIGWSKRKATSTTAEAVRVVEVPKVMLDERSFRLSSILLGNPSLAIINGRTYSEGEFLRVARAAGAAPAGALPTGLRVRVHRINDGAVVLQNQEQLITVMLTRPELPQRSSVEELLNEDRP